MSQTTLIGTTASKRPASNLLDDLVWVLGAVDDVPLQMAEEMRLKMSR
jgi:hypothetical protein